MDLGDFVDQVKDAVNPPGTDVFPNATEDEWVRRLGSGFWSARIEGITALDVYTADEDGLITPISVSGSDIPRELVQLVITWTAFKAITNQLTNLKSQFKAQAGPVSFEQQSSATLLKEALATLREEKALILERLGDAGTIPTFIADAVSSRDLATLEGFTSWLGA